MNSSTLLGGKMGPDTPFEWTWQTGGALVLACMCALLANSAGVGGGPFYMPLFNSVLGFGIDASTALSHTVVASSAIASSVYGIWQRSPIDPESSLVNFDLALTFVPALLVGTGIGVIFNSLLPQWLQTGGLLGLLAFVIYKTGKKALVAWRAESERKGHPGEEGAEEEERTLIQEVRDNHVEAGFQSSSSSSSSVSTNSNMLPSSISPDVSRGLMGCKDEDEGAAMRMIPETRVRRGLRHLREGNWEEMSSDAIEELNYLRHWVEIHGGWAAIAKRTEAAMVPLLKIMALWAVFLAFKLGMSRSPTCSLPFFGFWVGQTLLCTAVTTLVVLLHVRQLEKDRESMDPGMRQLLLGRHNERTTGQGIAKLLQAVVIMVVAGAIAGLLGIGGALIFNPFLLAMGVHPQVTASTAVLMILFSSSNISLSFHLHGLLNTAYAVVFAPACWVASLIGVTMVGRIIKRTGRASIIIIILTILIACGAILTGVVGGLRAYEDFRSGENLGFEPLCGD